jgi:hypothetical protein
MKGENLPIMIRLFHGTIVSSRRRNSATQFSDRRSIDTSLHDSEKGCVTPGKERTINVFQIVIPQNLIIALQSGEHQYKYLCVLFLKAMHYTFVDF